MINFKDYMVVLLTSHHKKELWKLRPIMFFSVPGFFRAPHSFSKILVGCKKWAANYSKYRQNISFGTITLFWPQAVVDQPRHLFEKDEFCKDPIHHMLERTTMKQIVANSQDWRLALCRFSCLVRQTCMQPTVKFLNGKISAQKEEILLYLETKK